MNYDLSWTKMISLSESDPRFRPPICLLVIGFVVCLLGVVVFFLTYLSTPITTSAILFPVSLLIIIVALIWLFITRKKVKESVGTKDDKADSEENSKLKNNSNSNQGHRFDPIMNRGLVDIHYKSCEDTLPYGSGRTPAGTKAVRVPPCDGFVSVESSCFQLIKSKADVKNSNKSLFNAKSIPGGLTATEKRPGKGRMLPSRPTNENLNDEPVALKDQKNRSTHISELDVRIKNSRALQHQMSEPPRSQVQYEMDSTKLEKQPMLLAHANVYRTDFLSTKRSR